VWTKIWYRFAIPDITYNVFWWDVEPCTFSQYASALLLLREKVMSEITDAYIINILNTF